MEEKNKRKGIIYSIIGIAALIALITGATYAYFQAQTKNGTNASVDITSGTTDHLVFATDGNITINASADNFKENGQDLSDTAIASAILTANNTNHIANDTYNVYLDITSNNLEYSSYKKESDTKIYLKQEDKEEDITNGVLDEYNPIPELYLTITGPKDYEYNIDLPVATLKENNDSYDITEKRGLVTIAEDVPISTTAPEGITTDTWTITITFKNLKTNQQLNTGKELKGKIIIQKEKLALSKLLADANKEGEEPTLIYHDGQKDYVKEANYALEAEDYSYRYSGGNDVVNNYVCFGGECSNDPTNDNYANLYRIIGLFDDDKDGIYNLKIIKADYATADELGGEGIGAYYGKIEDATSYYKGDLIYLNKVMSYYWNKQQNNAGDNTNNWETSNLNTENLNGTYLSYIQGKDNEIWYNMIEKHTWVTAGNSHTNMYQNAKTVFTSEIINTMVGDVVASAVPTYPARVGLMYVSDYMYGAINENWTISSSSYRSATDSNWIYMGLWEWTITRRTNNSGYSFYVNTNGNVSYNNVSGRGHEGRPVLYLKPEVKIVTGSGANDDPYILSQ